MEFMRVLAAGDKMQSLIIRVGDVRELDLAGARWRQSDGRGGARGTARGGLPDDDGEQAARLNGRRRRLMLTQAARRCRGVARDAEERTRVIPG
jgi:hypothetical protein